MYERGSETRYSEEGIKEEGIEINQDKHETRNCQKQIENKKGYQCEKKRRRERERKLLQDGYMNMRIHLQGDQLETAGIVSDAIEDEKN